ncbi:MAG: hypothetical protein ACXADL_12975 [Candidatus Thorarchaeota archaeon]|jgi:hypothetical protein
MSRDMIVKTFGRDYLDEMFEHFDGRRSLVEICDEFGYNIEPLRHVIEAMVTQGLLKVDSGIGDDAILVRTSKSIRLSIQEDLIKKTE